MSRTKDTPKALGQEEDFRCIILEDKLCPGWTQNLTNDIILDIIHKIGLNPNLPVQFKIPPPYVAWCHHCDMGFMTINECQDHNRDLHRIYKG